MSDSVKNPESVSTPSGLPYTHCLNCGSELKGNYCHSCGQEAIDKTPTVWGFVMAYLDNSFMWDAQFIRTFWTLISRPGQLTYEYTSGKFISQEHPLKLNMFLLSIFLMLFVFFASGDKVVNSVQSLTQDERVFSSAQIGMLADDPEYAKKIEQSPRDTVLLLAPLLLTENHPQLFSNIETKEDTNGEGLDKWVAAVPRVLIEDGIITIDQSGCYRFNTEAKVGQNGLDLLVSVLEEVSGIISKYFPMLLLLTAPFLSFSLKLVQRKSRIPVINHFIFSLHYISFMEAMMIVIYILHLTVAPSMKLMEYLMMGSSCLYLAIAYRKVYESSWIKAVVKSLLTSFIYFVNLLLIFIAIIIVACFKTAMNYS